LGTRPSSIREEPQSYAVEYTTILRLSQTRWHGSQHARHSPDHALNVPFFHRNTDYDEFIFCQGKGAFTDESAVMLDAGKR